MKKDFFPFFAKLEAPKKLFEYQSKGENRMTNIEFSSLSRFDFIGKPLQAPRKLSIEGESKKKFRPQPKDWKLNF